MIATDLDGSLLDSGGSVPAENVAAAREAAEAGIIVTVVTGRRFGSAVPYARQIGVAHPFVCFNGADAMRTDGTRLWHQPLELEVARECLAICRERGIYVQSYIGDEMFVRDATVEELAYYEANFATRGIAAGDAVFDPREAPTKLLMITEGAEATRETMKFFEDVFRGRAYVTSSGVRFVELMHAEVNKAAGLARLAAELGVAMEDVMAIGDGENDALMLERAGLGVAMGNARPGPRAAADVIAPTNDERGFAWAIRELALR